MESGPSEAFHFKLSPQAMEERCQTLWQQFHSPSQRLAALMAMEDLLALAPPGDRESPSYRSIRSMIARYAETARAELLQECGDRLREAVSHRDVGEISHLHGMLSRNGFWQMAQSASRQLEYATQLDVLNWLECWLQDARSKAEEASGYPDTFNFLAAGIDVAEFAAMQELLHCMRST